MYNSDRVEPKEIINELESKLKEISPVYRNPEARADLYYMISYTLAGMLSNASFYSDVKQQIAIWKTVVDQEESQNGS